MSVKLTEARKAWLVRLRDEGAAKRAKSRTGYDCMQAGWTEWNIFDRSGRPLSMSEWTALFREKREDEIVHHGGLERITDKGRALLAQERTDGR